MDRKDSRASCILVVDDEPEICQLMGDALRGGNLHPMLAGSATQAMDLAAANHPDLIVADINLPDYDGLELVRRLRQKWGELPAVIVTGLADPSALTAASRLRPVEVLTKPLDMSRLRQTVLTELDRQQNYRRVQRRTRRLRDLARHVNRQRKHAYKNLCVTCTTWPETAASSRRGWSDSRCSPSTRPIC